jgi:transposase
VATLQKKKSRGKTYWQIVESRRVNGKPRPIVLMHLGTAEKLLHRLQQDVGKPIKAKVLQFGALAALWNIAQELQIVEIIDRHVEKRHQGLSCGQYILLATLNRCVGATSKKSLYEWYCKTVLSRLIPTSMRSLSSQRFWDHMSYFDEQTINAIEKEVTKRLLEHFKIDVRTLLFDATNFDTYINTQTQGELAQRGHAKSKRKDLRIIGLALLVSSDFHIPLLSYVYPGNHNDPTMFAGVIDELVERYKQFTRECQDITLVFDGGNTSTGNMKEVGESDYHFITSLTLTHHKDLLDIPLSRFDSFSELRLQGTSAHRTKKEVWGKERTIVITRSDNLLAGQLAGINTSLGKKRAELRGLRTKLRRSQLPGARGKGYTEESLQKRLKSIVSGQFTAEILKSEIRQSEGFLDFRFWTDSVVYNQLIRTRLGKRILCSDNESWSTEQIILGSRAQSCVEDAFKEMKNPHWTSFSPAFHWTDQKLRVHCFYCLLSLTLSSLLARQSAQANINLSTHALYEQLTDVTEVLNFYSMDSGAGRPRIDYVLSERSSLQDKLCRLFNVYALSRCAP